MNYKTWKDRVTELGSGDLDKKAILSYSKLSYDICADLGIETKDGFTKKTCIPKDMMLYVFTKEFKSQWRTAHMKVSKYDIVQYMILLLECIKLRMCELKQEMR